MRRKNWLTMNQGEVCLRGFSSCWMQIYAKVNEGKSIETIQSGKPSTIRFVRLEPTKQLLRKILWSGVERSSKSVGFSREFKILIHKTGILTKIIIKLWFLQYLKNEKRSNIKLSIVSERPWKSTYNKRQSTCVLIFPPLLLALFANLWAVNNECKLWATRFILIKPWINANQLFKNYI